MDVCYYYWINLGELNKHILYIGILLYNVININDVFSGYASTCTLITAFPSPVKDFYASQNHLPLFLLALIRLDKHKYKF